MNWVDETIKKVSGSEPPISKAEIKREILEAAKVFLSRGWDWKDIEIVMVAQLRPLVGEYILLLHKWICEVRDEEREVPTP